MIFVYLVPVFLLYELHVGYALCLCVKFIQTLPPVSFESSLIFMKWSLDLTTLSSLLYTLFFFFFFFFFSSLSPLFLASFGEGIMFRLAIGIVVFLKELSIRVLGDDWTRKTDEIAWAV